MDEFSLTKLLQLSGRRMRADLAERLVPHGGELGSGREEIIRRFLQDYLPKKFEVSAGFAFDSHGKVSKQLDIIIANSFECPLFRNCRRQPLFAVESIVAVGQVKSSMTSRKQFRSALENIASVKALDRSAGGRAIDKASGETIDHLRNHLHQVFAFIFVTGSALDEATAHQELLDYVCTTPAHIWPNIVFALDQYLGTFCCDDGVARIHFMRAGVAMQKATDDDILMRFYLLVGGAIEATKINSFPYWAYLHEVNKWSAGFTIQRR